MGEVILRSDKTSKKNLLIIVAIALGIRLLLMVHFKTYVIDTDWGFGYETGQIAKSIATGKGFSSPFFEPTGPTAWLAPVYPLFLGSIFIIFGVFTINAAIVTLTINCLFSALTIIPLYYLTKDLFGQSVGYLTAIAFAFYPPSIWHSITTIWDTTIFTFIVIVLISWLYLISKRLVLKNAALYGIFMGFVILVNPVIIIFYPFALIWLFLQPIASKAIKIKSIIILFTLLLIMISPWILRNYIVFRRFIIRSNFGLELKLGNNLQTWNVYKSESNTKSHSNPLNFAHPTRVNNELIRFSELGEINYIDQALDEALKFIKENPWKFLQLTLRRIHHFWLSDFNENNQWKGQLKTSISLSELKTLCILIPLPFMLIGIFLAIKKKLDIIPLISFMLFIPIVYYITHVTERYRYPIEPIILILASYGFYSLIRWIKK